jgi:hypothetical protein
MGRSSASFAKPEHAYGRGAETVTPRSTRSTIALAVLVIAGCSPTGTGGPSPTVPPPPQSSTGGIGLPPDCEPLDLRDPSGARVDLTGEWEAVDALVAPEERVWLQQIGDCLYGSVFGVYASGSSAPETFVVDVGGDVNPSFTIDLEVVMVYQDAVFDFATYSTAVMLIEWDADGRIRLREDREVTERAGWCAAQPQFDCPPPVIWYRAGEGPSS